MNYVGRKQATLGDRAKLWGSVLGTVVCSIDDDKYSVGFAREHWADKGRGMVIEADDGRIFYCDAPDEDFGVLRPGGSAVE